MRRLLFMALLGFALFSSCSKDEEPQPMSPCTETNVLSISSPDDVDPAAAEAFEIVASEANRFDILDEKQITLYFTNYELSSDAIFDDPEEPGEIKVDLSFQVPDDMEIIAGTYELSSDNDFDLSANIADEDDSFTIWWLPEGSATISSIDSDFICGSVDISGKTGLGSDAEDIYIKGTFSVKIKDL